MCWALRERRRQRRSSQHEAIAAELQPAHVRVGQTLLKAMLDEFVLVPDEHDDENIENRQYDQSERLRVGITIKLIDDEQA